MATVMVSLMVLLLTSAIELFDPVSPWVPTRLASALPALAAGTAPSGYTRPLACSVVLIAILLAAAIVGARRREVRN